MSDTSASLASHDPEVLAAEYLKRRDALVRAADRLESLVNAWLTAEAINYLSVSARAKTVGSFVVKARRLNADGSVKYPKPLTDLTDLVGLRVITYLPAAVDQVCAIIEQQFQVEEKDDKGARNAARGEYGYASKHLLLRLTDERKALPEYADLCDLTFEVQVRTAGQHAWAEFEHDTRYKADDLGARRPDINRRFVLTAALVEMVDREFSEIDRIYQQAAGEASIAADVHPAEVSSATAERSSAAATSPSSLRQGNRTASTSPVSPQDRNSDEGRGAPPEPLREDLAQTHSSSTAEFNARSLPALLSRRYPTAVSSRKEHYENLARLLGSLGIRTASDLEAELADVDSTRVADAMVHQFPAGQVRRLEDDLLAARGSQFITSYGQTLGAQGTPRRTLENRWSKLLGARFTEPQ